MGLEKRRLGWSRRSLREQVRSLSTEEAKLGLAEIFGGCRGAVVVPVGIERGERETAGDRLEGDAGFAELLGFSESGAVGFLDLIGHRQHDHKDER